VSVPRSWELSAGSQLVGFLGVVPAPKVKA
jgi:hypothetical protein